MSDVTFDLRNNRMQVHQQQAEPWTRDAGGHRRGRRMTGGRLKRVRQYVDERPSASPTATASATSTSRELDRVPPRARRAGHGHRRAAPGPLRRRSTSMKTQVTAFQEKPPGDGGWINGGFFVLEPAVLDSSRATTTVWEREPLEQLARDGAADGLQARRLLAADGHAARQDALEELWAVGRRALEDVVTDRPRLLARPARVRHRPHRLQGRLAGALAAPTRAPR